MPDYESLVDQIYEAATNPDLWPQVMHDLGGAVDAAGGIILTRRSDAWLGWRYSAAFEKATDAFLAGGGGSKAASRLIGLNRFGFVACQEVCTEDEYLQDDVVREMCAPIGLYYCSATAIPVPTGDLVVVRVNRRIGQPHFDRDDIARLDAFRPHLARAGLLAARWRLERLRTAAEALAMIGLPAAILDARGKVIAANTLIEELHSHLVWLPKDRIALIDPRANELLRCAIAEFADPAAASVRSFPAKGTVDNPVVVHVIPATGEARDLFEGGFGVLAVTPLAAPSAPDLALIQGLFDLTAAEARVTSGVTEGLTLDQIAERHGVALGTIRTQIKSVFAKTGSSRQSQLAALLAAQPKIPLEPPTMSE